MDQSVEEPDEPERLEIQTIMVEEEIVIRAELLHFNNPQNTQILLGNINPNTGHVEPEGATAIYRAAGPD